MATGNTDVNLSFEISLRLIGKILDKHAPLKKTKKKQTKRKNQTLSQKGNKTINKNKISYTNNLSNQKLTKPAQSNKWLLKSTETK